MPIEAYVVLLSYKLRGSIVKTILPLPPLSREQISGLPMHTCRLGRQIIEIITHRIDRPTRTSCSYTEYDIFVKYTVVFILTEHYCYRRTRE